MTIQVRIEDINVNVMNEFQKEVALKIFMIILVGLAFIISLDILKQSIVR